MSEGLQECSSLFPFGSSAPKSFCKIPLDGETEKVYNPTTCYQTTWLTQFIPHYFPVPHPILMRYSTLSFSAHQAVRGQLRCMPTGFFSLVLLVLACCLPVLAQTAPSAPFAPLYSDLTPTTLTVTVPPLSTGSTSLSLQRSPNASTWTTLATGLGGNATYGDTGLTKATTYYYRAVAVNGVGSASGSVVTLSTPSGNPTLPNLPTFSNIQSKSLTVKVSGVPADATNITLQRSPDNGTWTTLTTGLAGSATYNDSGLNPNTTYYYSA